MSFLNHLKQRQQQAMQQGDEAVTRRRVPARLMLQNSTLNGPLSAPNLANAPHLANGSPRLSADSAQYSPFMLIPPSPPMNRNDFVRTLPPEATGLSSSYNSNSGSMWEHHRKSVDNNDGLSPGYAGSHTGFSTPGTPSSPSLRGITMDSPQPCRSVYLGNLPADVTAAMVLDKVHCGPIEAYRFMPEKGCAFVAFVDQKDAQAFYQEATQTNRKLMINGQDIKVAWGKPSPIPQQVQREISDHNASRNVFVGDLQYDDTEERIRKTMEGFGPLDTLRILPDKRICFVHFCTIQDAIKAVREMTHDPAWEGRRINFGKDRCSPVNPRPAEELQQPQPMDALIHRLAAVALRAGINPAALLSQTPPGSARQRSMSARFSADSPGLDSPMPRTPNSATFDMATPPPDPNTRTVYLGNLHAETTLEDLCNVIRGGGLEEIKLFTDRGIAFITFLESDAAHQFLARVNSDGLSVRHRKVKAGWGKASPALLQAVREAVVYNGASRNVYIGGINEDPDFSVEKIRSDFEAFGEIELVNRPVGMDCVFVNFARIQSAIRAVEEMNNGTGVGGSLMRKYEGKRINYGKDRCANPPRNSSAGVKPKADIYSLEEHSIIRDLPCLPAQLPTGIVSMSRPPRTPPANGNGRYEVPQLRRMRASTTGMW